MSDEHGSVEGTLGTLAPVKDEELTELAEGEGVQALFHEIVSLAEVPPLKRPRRLRVQPWRLPPLSLSVCCSSCTWLILTLRAPESASRPEGTSWLPGRRTRASVPNR